MSEAQEKIRESLHEIFIAEIKAIGCECFTGGSFRFGYYNADSDIDIMVKDPGPSLKGQIMQALKLKNNRAASILQHTGSNYNHPDIESVWSYKDLVHVVFIYTHAYEQLSQDHIHLDLFYGKYPVLLKIIPYLKSVGLNGGTIFRLMRDFSMSSLS